MKAFTAMWKKLRQYNRDTDKLSKLSSLSFQNRLILSYSFVLVLILMAGIFLYQISYQQMKSGIDSQNSAVLSSAVRRMDDTMTTISAVAQQLSDNSSFTTLAGFDSSGTDSFNYHAFLTQRDLKTAMALEQLLTVSDAFIYMKNSGYIISTSEFLSFESYAKYRLLCAPEMAQKLEDAFHMESNRNRFISLQEFDSRRDGYLYFYPIASGNVFSEKYIQSYLCCMIDQDLIQEYFSGLPHDISVITARDAAGNGKFLLSQGDLSASSRKVLTTEAVSDYNNWTYTLQQPQAQAYYSISRYRTLFACICVLAVLLGGAMVYYFSVVNSRPVTKLANELVVKEKLATSLTDLVEKNRPLVNESYVRRIMEGNVATDDEMEYIRQELHLNRTGIKYQVLYVEVYPSEDYNVQLGDMALCLQNFDILVRDAVKRHFPDTGYLCKPSSRIFSVLLASPDSMSYDQVMVHNREAFNEFHTELLNQYGIWSRGGFGGRNSRLSNTWKSYQQAKDAKTITTAEHYVQSYSEFVSSNDVYYYPEIMSVQLTAAISTGNREQVAEIFHLISKENTVSRSLSRTQRQQLLADVRSTLFKKTLQPFPGGFRRYGSA